MDISGMFLTTVNNFISPPSNAYTDLSEIMSCLQMSSPSTSISISQHSSNIAMDDPNESPKKILPPRTAKENFLQKCKRRVITKPKKKDVKMSASFIRKLYIENKPKNFRPSNLETIYEEPVSVRDELKFVDLKKKKRSLSCSDGVNVTKATIKSRRLRIKREFGRRFLKKKISLEDFIQRLNASLESQDAQAQQSDSGFIKTTCQETQEEAN